METIEDYLRDLELSHSYEIDGEKRPLEEFNGVAYSLENGDQTFLEWSLHYDKNEYYVVLSEVTPGIVESVSLEDLEAKLLTGEYIPVSRTESGYQEADYY